MKKLLSVMALLVVATVVCFSSVSTIGASRKSPTATTAKPKPTTHPRNTNNDPSAHTGNPGGGDDSSKDPSTVNPQDDSSEWLRTSTTNPYYVGPNGDDNGPNNGNGSNTSPVTGDFVMYSVLIAAGLGLSSLFAYKKYTSKKK